MKTAYRSPGTFSALAVAAVYVAFVLGAPLLLRYGPELDTSSAVARVAIQDVATPRCAYAPEFGRSCAAR